MVAHAYGGTGPLILGVNISQAIIATTLVGLRVANRFRKGPDAPWALVFSTLAWFFAIVQMSTLCVGVSFGMGSHIYDLSEQQVSQALEWSWITQSILVFDYGLGKAAVVAYILEVQGPTYNVGRWVLIFLAVSNILLCTVESVLLVFPCHPVQKFWMAELPGYCNYEPGTVFGYIQGSWITATDFFLAGYPAFIIWQLQMKKRLKLGLSTLLGLGAFCGACAIAKTVEIGIVKKTKDPTYELFRLILWATTEMWLTIILPSIPPLWPLFREIFRGVKSTTRSRKSRHASGWKEESSLSHELAYRGNMARSAGNATTEFRRLGSEAGSDEIAAPRDGIMMKRNITVEESRD